MTENSWGVLSPRERVRVCLEAIVDGTTAEAGDVQGLDQELIEEIDNDQPGPISEAYRAFLAAAGKGAGRFLQGSDVFHPQILGVRKAAEELVEHHGFLTDDDRVILMHQGCQFDFTRGGGPDPEVWSYCEGSEPERHYPSFTDWLRANAEEQTKAWAHLVPWYEEA
ncbi:hypothetical protein [Actinomadura sp. DC4]|uniref:hypothetical protein n=1 Tax=Actinomadura sp. DC4 TaxID=3055069 RepID=UPI0025AF5350|nr:hypothetical protein [Actinomadura sp. DC4]MDN3353011.1 hypothetical protein [Actinomadura sp. DC4]